MRRKEKEQGQEDQGRKQKKITTKKSQPHCLRKHVMTLHKTKLLNEIAKARVQAKKKKMQPKREKSQPKKLQPKFQFAPAHCLNSANV